MVTSTQPKLTKQSLFHIILISLWEEFCFYRRPSLIHVFIYLFADYLNELKYNCLRLLQPVYPNAPPLDSLMALHQLTPMRNQLQRGQHVQLGLASLLVMKSLPAVKPHRRNAAFQSKACGLLLGKLNSSTADVSLLCGKTTENTLTAEWFSRIGLQLVQNSISRESVQQACVFIGSGSGSSLACHPVDECRIEPGREGACSDKQELISMKQRRAALLAAYEPHCN